VIDRYPNRLSGSDPVDAGELRGKISIPSGISCRLDKYIADLLGISRAKVQRHISEGHITVNGRSARSSHLLQTDDIVEYAITSYPSPSLRPEPIPLAIRFEDRYLIVVDKPAGMVVHPAPGAREGTLVHALLHRYKDFSFPPEDIRPGIVHRLDKNTSGLLLVAKNEDIKAILARAIAERKIKRIYLALTLGHLTEREGTISAPIGRHPADRRRMATFGTSLKEAVTSYRVIESYDACELIEVTLQTGRTHQIRVHFSSIGHPIVGDSLYHGGRGRERGFSGKHRERVRAILLMIDRQALHAHRLSFPHPITGELQAFESEIPRDMQNLLEYLRGGRIDRLGG